MQKTEEDLRMIRFTGGKTILRRDFIKFVECLDQTGYELPGDLDEDVRSYIVRTWKQLKEQGRDANSLFSRQVLDDLVMAYQPTETALRLSKLALEGRRGIEATPNPMQGAIDACEAQLQQLAKNAKPGSDKPT